MWAQQRLWQPSDRDGRGDPGWDARRLRLVLLLQLLQLLLQLGTQLQQFPAAHLHRLLQAHAGVPSAVVGLPELYAAQAGHGEEHVLLWVAGVQRVGVLLRLAVHQGPQRLRQLTHVLLDPLLLRVVEECPEQAAVQVVQDGDKEVLVELKRILELGREKSGSLQMSGGSTVVSHIKGWLQQPPHRLC